MADSVLAIDLGKTACRAALWLGEDRREAAGPGAPGLASPGGELAAEAAILAVAQPLLRAAGLAQVTAAGFAAAGALAAPAAARSLAARLCASLPAGSAAVSSDAVAAHLGAFGGGTGVVLALGTGAVAIALAADGALHQLDGAGPWLGDSGGGAWLGLRGLRAALAAAERRGPATSLTAAAEATFGPLRELGGVFESNPNPPALAASFVPAIARAAETGDAVAGALLAQAAAALAATAQAAAAEQPVRLALTGGLAPLFAEPLRASLATGPLELMAPQGTALDGARLLATRRDTPHERYTHRAVRDATADRLDWLATEAVRSGLETLDQQPPAAIVRLLLEAERAGSGALGRAEPALATAAEAVAARLLAGGRLFYLGAGTPGRLAVLDAAELGPTYSAPPGLVVPLLAGGLGAMVEAVEGAEDDPHAAAAALDQHGVSPADAVVGITASGRTPYVVGGLQHAAERGALTVAIVNNAASPAAEAAQMAVEILTGAEVVAGSTRMAAGTAQKVALNALSTAAMIALGKTYGARMVDLRATNAKLRRRALRIVCELTGAAAPLAEAALAEAGGKVKPALVALLTGVDVSEAERRLRQAGGRVRDAIAEGERR